MEAEIGLPVRKRLGASTVFSSLKKRRRVHVDSFKLGILRRRDSKLSSRNSAPTAPVRQASFCFEVIRIAAFNPRLRSLGQCSFHAHDSVRHSLRGCRIVADELENVLHMLNVALASLFGFGVVFGVVVAIGQAQAALVKIRRSSCRNRPDPAQSPSNKIVVRTALAGGRPEA